MGPQRPARHFLTDLLCGHALVLAVVPFDQVVVEGVDGQPGELGGAHGPLPRATQHEDGMNSCQHAAQSNRLLLAIGRQRNIGPAGVPTGPTPLGFAMADQPELRVSEPRPDHEGRFHMGTGLHRRVQLAHAFLVSQKIVSISAIKSSSFWPSAGSTVPLPPAAPAALVARLNRSCSWGYFSKCGGLK